MRSLLDRVLFMIGIQVKRRQVMNVGAHNAGFITYIAILTMSFLLLLAFMGLRIGQICESNVVDELHLEEAHYAAQKGVHWFVGYCKLGNVWDFQNKLVVIDDENVEITIEADQSTDNPRHIMSYGKLKNSEIVSRVHMYVTVDKEKHMHVIKVKPY
nr:MAG TPA: hypothetical protein [Caudoviricetes sp.]DAK21953.1 MAG TPA: hypothetical protein [Caudoviricetes sp.]